MDKHCTTSSICIYPSKRISQQDCKCDIMRRLKCKATRTFVDTKIFEFHFNLEKYPINRFFKSKL